MDQGLVLVEWSSKREPHALNANVVQQPDEARQETYIYRLRNFKQRLPFINKSFVPSHMQNQYPLQLKRIANKLHSQKESY